MRRSALLVVALLIAFAAAPCRAATTSTDPGPGGAPDVRDGHSDRGPDQARDGGRSDAGGPDAGTPDAVDQDLLDHLDVLNDMELLQNLDLFDTGAPKGR